MKSIFLSLLLVLVFCFSAFGASSGDVYLRQDVFEARMYAFMSEIRREFDKQLHDIEKQVSEIRGDIKAMNERIDGNYQALNERIDGNYQALNERIDGNYQALNKRIDDSYNFFYLIIVLLGLVIAMPFIQKGLEKRELRKEQTIQTFTLDDVKKLINEAIMTNNLSVQEK